MNSEEALPILIEGNTEPSEITEVILTVQRLSLEEEYTGSPVEAQSIQPYVG